MQYLNTTATGAVKATAGTLYGVVVNSHSSGTVIFNDGAGATSAGVKATGVLTSSGVFQDGETVTIEGHTYTFKTALVAGTPDEVLIGANAAASLDNFKSAVNGTAGEGSTYGTGTVAHDLVTATTNSATAQTVEAKRIGTYANAYATTETCDNVAWGAVVMESGAESSILMINTFSYPTGSGVYMFGEGISFHKGLYYTEGGTAEVTIIYK
jgi:hypothetical protein